MELFTNPPEQDFRNLHRNQKRQGAKVRDCPDCSREVEQRVY